MGWRKDTTETSHIVPIVPIVPQWPTASWQHGTASIFFFLTCPDTTLSGKGGEQGPGRGCGSGSRELLSHSTPDVSLVYSCLFSRPRINHLWSVEPANRKNHEESVSELEIFWQEPMIYIYILYIYRLYSRWSWQAVDRMSIAALSSPCFVRHC